MGSRFWSSLLRKGLLTVAATLGMAMVGAGSSYAQLTLSPSSQTVVAGPSYSATITASAVGIPDGTTVFFKVISGPNMNTEASTTLSGGSATFTYFDGPFVPLGTDTIQACADPDAGISESADADFAECAGESGDGGGDPISNSVTVTWDASVLLENFDGLNSVFTTADAFNLVGTTHTVRITVSGVTGICNERPESLDGADFDDGNACNSDADCADPDDFCDFSGYNVGILVTGQNSYESTFQTTGPDGTATFQYTDTNGAGLDVIQGCLDLGEGGGIDDTVSACISDSEPFEDIASNTVNKYWLANFVTGGGKISGPNKNTFWTFGGIVGPNPAGPGIVGQWQEVAHGNGTTRACHWNSFSSLIFSGPATTNPPSTHNTATFATNPGICSDKTTPSVNVVEVDNGESGKSKDTLDVQGGGNLTIDPAKTLASGNIQVHDTP